MRPTTPKNRIVPMVIYAVVSTIIAMIIVIYHMNSMVKKSYNETIHLYDTLSEDTTKLLRKGFQENCETLQTAADFIGNQEILTKETMMEALTILAREDVYLNLAIVDASGIGMDTAGIDVNLQKEQLFQDAMQGHSGVTGTTEGGVPIIVYSVPIRYQTNYLGALFAWQEASLDFLGEFNLDPSYKLNNNIYILNEHDELVAYLNDSEIKDFQYDKVISGGTIHQEGDSHTVGYGLDLFHKPSKGNINTIWYKKPLGMNYWTVLIGRSDIINPVSQNIIRLSSILWVVILFSILILFLTLIIYLRRSNQKLMHMLHLDPVTGGVNWYKFRIDANKLLNSRMFYKKKYALINFDINRFKMINDSFGHQKGDEVLKEIYNLIKKWVRQGEPFTRYAADQFYVLIEYQEPEEVNTRINDLNNRLHQLKFTKTSKFYFGVYFITERKDSIDRMGDFAGKAKQTIKGSSEELISYFDDNSRIRLLEEEKIEKTMYDALENNEFLVYLQPKYTVAEEEVSGAEALVRWNKSNGNMLSPGFFIPIFEKNGFISELDMYMLRNVCRIQKSWLERGYMPVPISVNISRVHFANPHLADIILDTVDEFGIPHELIELELSESAFLQNKQMLISTVILLREYGFLVSMDDFGAGYSSLNSLKDLPLDVVKLDGELFRITDEVERGQTVIRNTISMAKDLHMKVVAECIETREQVEFLCTVGCDIIQGYYYAKPMPVEQFETRYMLRQELDEARQAIVN